MDYAKIGANIRKYRLLKKITQEELAEKVGLTDTYIGMLERGEKSPSFETFINILNALEISADVVLCDVLTSGYEVKNSLLNERLEKISREDRTQIYDVIDTMLKHCKKIKF